MSKSPEHVAQTNVKSVMSRDVVTIDSQESAHRALELMDAERVTAIPVTTFNNQCLGILSRTDLAEIVLEMDSRFQTLSTETGSMASQLSDGQSLHQITVRELMNDTVLTVDSGDSVASACAIMNQHQVHHLPVIEGDRVIGMLSTMDVVKLVAEEGKV